eukprot:g12553.t1
MNLAIAQQTPVPDELIGPLRDSTGIVDQGDALRSRLADDGYLFLRGVVDSPIIAAAREEVFNRLAEVGEIAPPAREGIFTGNSRRREQAPDLGAFWQSVNEGPALRRATHGEQIAELMRTIFGEPARAHDFMFLRPGPVGRSTHLHYDLPFFARGSSRIVTVWLALGAIPIEEGPLMVLEGSNRFADLIEPIRAIDYDSAMSPQVQMTNDTVAFVRERNTRLLTADFTPGDLVVFDMLTMHGTLDNHSSEGRVRLSCDVRWQPDADPIDPRYTGPNPTGTTGAGYGELNGAKPLTEDWHKRCYNPKSKVPTPHMNRFAKSGMRFTDAHTPSSVCTPTRYGVLTGRYAWRTKLKKGVLWGYSPALIDTKRMTLASLLKSKGYHTACIGKWHLGLGTDEKTDYTKPLHPCPNDYGFDYFFGIPASLDMDPYVYVENDRVVAEPTLTVKRSEQARRGGGGFWRGGPIAPGFKHAEVLPMITRRATGFIKGRSLKYSDKPFFLYLPLSAPHTPWLPTKEFRGKSGAGTYGDFAVQVDDTVGQVLQTLDRLDMTQNTLVIVTSDNGAHWTPADIKKFGHRANRELRGQKADAWEGGHRVPFLVRWPGVVKANTVSNETICLTDLLATVAAVVDTPLPENAGEDSFSILPVLKGETLKRPIRTETVHHSVSGMFAIRHGLMTAHVILAAFASLALNCSQEPQSRHCSPLDVQPISTRSTPKFVPATSKSQAVAGFKKLGARFRYEAGRPEKTVVGLFLDETPAMDDHLSDLKWFPNLRVLRLDYCGISDAGLAHLTILKKLKWLSLAGVEIGNDGLKHLNDLSELQTLILFRTNVTDAGMKSLKGMRELQHLDLFHCRISDVGLKHLSPLKRLQTLDLDSTKVGDAGMRSLSDKVELRKLILGALGSAIVKATINVVGADNVVGLARTPAKAESLGVEIRPGDYQSRSDLRASLRGVDALLLVSGMDAPERRIEQHRNVIEAAKDAGVSKLVYTSVQGAEEETAFSPIVQSNRQTEDDVRNSGLDWAIGRNGIYIEPDVEYIETYRQRGEIANCAGDGKCGYTTRPELAFAYARMLTQPEHNGRTYNLHGVPISQQQLADYLNHAFGTNLRYRPMTVAEYRDERIAELGEFLGNVIAGIYEGIRNGAANNESHFAQAAGRDHQSWPSYFDNLKAAAD